MWLIVPMERVYTYSTVTTFSTKIGTLLKILTEKTTVLISTKFFQINFCRFKIWHEYFRGLHPIYSYTNQPRKRERYRGASSGLDEIVALSRSVSRGSVRIPRKKVQISKDSPPKSSLFRNILNFWVFHFWSGWHAVSSAIAGAHCYRYLAWAGLVFKIRMVTNAFTSPVQILRAYAWPSLCAEARMENTGGRPGWGKENSSP